MARQAHLIELIDRIGADPEEAAGESSGTWPITSRSKDVTSLLRGAKFAATYGAPVLFAEGIVAVVGFMMISFSNR